MKKYLAGLAFILLAASSLAFPHFQENHVKTGEFETEHYRFHLVTSFGESTGSLEPLVRQEGKRDMVLKVGPNTDPVRTCRILYQNSLTEHSNPCSKLQERIYG